MTATYLQSEFIWMILGISMIILEMFLVPGIGLLFVGLGAITTFAFITLGFLESELDINIAIFLVSSLIWTIILWYPLKSLRKSKKSFNDMVGSIVNIDADLEKGKIGTIIWSGVQMRATLDQKEQLSIIKKGSKARITHIEGNLLHLTEEK